MAERPKLATKRKEVGDLGEVGLTEQLKRSLTTLANSMPWANSRSERPAMILRDRRRGRGDVRGDHHARHGEAADEGTTAEGNRAAGRAVEVALRGLGRGAIARER